MERACVKMAMQELHAVTARSAPHVRTMHRLHAPGESMQGMHRDDALTVAEGQDMRDLHTDQAPR